MTDRVLVTGASGVVGGAAVRALRTRGYDVVTLQRRELPTSLVALDVEHVRGDITDHDVVARACTGVSAIVHAAARVDVVGAWRDFEATNVLGTETLLDAARRAGVGAFVYVSSPSVAHGGASLVAADADPADPDRARSHYARSKALAERSVLEANGADMATVAIRPHLVWGPGDAQLTERIVSRARAGRLVIIGSGAALIDTTYIDNAGTALAAAVVRATEPSVRGRAFVVSNGEPRTVSEMLTRIALAAGAPAPTRHVPYMVARLGGHAMSALWSLADRAGEPPVTAFVAEQLATAHWFDQQETQKALGWRPEISIDEGFERLTTWCAAHR